MNDEPHYVGLMNGRETPPLPTVGDLRSSPEGGGHTTAEGSTGLLVFHRKHEILIPMFNLSDFLTLTVLNFLKVILWLYRMFLFIGDLR